MPAIRVSAAQFANTVSPCFHSAAPSSMQPVVQMKKRRRKQAMLDKAYRHIHVRPINPTIGRNGG